MMEESIAVLKEKITNLEKSVWASKGSSDEITPDLRRARRHVEETNCYSSVWKHCPSNYYALR